MLLTLTLPQIGDRPGATFIEVIHAGVDTQLAAGAKLIDVRVDLSAVVTHDCPPVSFYRIALREPACLRRLDVTAGAPVRVGDGIALCSTTADEPLDAPATRALRVSIVGIVRQGPWWKGSGA